MNKERYKAMGRETVLASQTWSLKERAFSGIGVRLSIDIDMGLVLTIASDLRVTETIGKVASFLESGTHFLVMHLASGGSELGQDRPCVT